MPFSHFATIRHFITNLTFQTAEWQCLFFTQPLMYPQIKLKAFFHRPFRELLKNAQKLNVGATFGQDREKRKNKLGLSCAKLRQA